MQSEEYQRVIKTFLEEGTTEETLFTGLAAEVGEVMSERVKETRTGAERTDEIVDELSDVLWYVATIANARGSSLEEIMTHSTCKLISRTLYGKE
jgi:NTP pyrophosphatase (non-canonical NTP hydrolase)